MRLYLLVIISIIFNIIISVPEDKSSITLTSRVDPELEAKARRRYVGHSDILATRVLEQACMYLYLTKVISNTYATLLVIVVIYIHIIYLPMYF